MRVVGEDAIGHGTAKKKTDTHKTIKVFSVQGNMNIGPSILRAGCVCVSDIIELRWNGMRHCVGHICGTPNCMRKL